MGFHVKPEDFPEGHPARVQIEAAEARIQSRLDAVIDGEPPPARRITNRPEEDLQKELIRTADGWPMALLVDREHWGAEIAGNMLGRYLYHIPNQRSVKIERRILSAMGVRPGVADLFLMVPVARSYHPWDNWRTDDPDLELRAGLYMECKAGANDLTDHQAAFLGRAKSLSYDTAEIRDGGEFQRVIEAYFKDAWPLSGMKQ